MSEESLRQEIKNELQKKYHGLITVLVGIIVIALGALLITKLSPQRNQNRESTQNHESTQNTQYTEQLEWSEWMENLPLFVTSEYYTIEEQTLYKSKTMEIKTSIGQSEMPGWELYNTVEQPGEFGAWSDWNENEVVKSENREVETKLYYRSRNIETTTNANSTLDGWELSKTTYTWSEYGGWSDWSTNAVSGSESRDIETKTQYSYRNVRMYSSADPEDPRYIGLEKAGVAYDYGPWSEWSTYYDSDLDGVEWQWRDNNGVYELRYREVIAWYNFVEYGPWGEWCDENRKVLPEAQRTRVVYRFRDRHQIPTYHFWRWGNWTEWDDEQITASDTRQIETMHYYRYRDRMMDTIYYYRRWSDWSSYSTEVVVPSETTKVETLTQYRFKSKD